MNSVVAFGGRVKEREIAEATVQWCIQKMMPRMKTLDITIKISDLDAYGYCMQEEAREYTLSLRRNMSLFDFISTICHEMIHVKQYARRELRQVQGKTMWKAKNHSNTEYDDAPWEKEAFKREAALALECFQDLHVLV